MGNGLGVLMSNEPENVKAVLLAGAYGVPVTLDVLELDEDEPQLWTVAAFVGPDEDSTMYRFALVSWPAMHSCRDVLAVLSG